MVDPADGGAPAAEDIPASSGANAGAAAPNGLAPSPVTGIRPPATLCLEGNVAESWKLFRQKWEIYSMLTRLECQRTEYQVALLLHTLGDEGLRVYNSFELDNPSIAGGLQRFEEFAVGELNQTYERFVFNKRSQQHRKSFNTFYSSVCSLAKTCGYCPDCRDSIIRDMGCDGYTKLFYSGNSAERV